MIKVKINNQPANIEFLKFPAGENCFKCHTKFTAADEISITWKYESDEELVLILQLLHYFKSCEISLYIPYMPHARQDRQTSKEMPYSLSAIGNPLLCNAWNIKILDLHSFTYFDEDRNISPTTIPELVRDLRSLNYDFVVSPDKGAKNRALEWASILNTPLLMAEKTRDPLTGKLSNPLIPKIDLTGKRLLIVDDICDGGYTFVQLSKVLKQCGADEVDLYVTHGIFSKGLPIEGIDRILTTNSYCNLESNKYLKVFDVLNLVGE